MTANAYLALYLACGFLLLAWMALLAWHRARAAFWMSLLWPLVLLMIPVIVALDWLADSRGWALTSSSAATCHPSASAAAPLADVAGPPCSACAASETASMLSPSPALSLSPASACSPRATCHDTIPEP